MRLTEEEVRHIALLARMGHYGLETYVPVIELRKED